MKSLVKWLVQLSCLGLGLLTMANWFGDRHPAWDLLAHFKPQFCLALGLGCLALSVLRSRKLRAVALLLLIINLVEVAPWYLRLPAMIQAVIPASQARTNAAAPVSLKVLLANVLFGNRAVEPLQQLIETEAPDMVVLQEANEDQVSLMSRFKATLPYHFRARHLPYGLAVWSRYPISEPKFLLLGDQDLPSLSGNIHFGNRTVELFTTHLTSPVRKPAWQRNRQLADVAAYLRAHPETDLVLGDFNVSMWSPFYRRLEQQSGFRNCRRGFGVLPSWPAQLPALARIPIDHCLTSGSLKVRDMHLGPNVGSDHLPLIVSLGE